MNSSATQTKTKWTIDNTHSSINFNIKHLMIAHVKGHFKTFEASIYTEGHEFNTAEIDLWIDASSITTGDVNRDEHLKGADFLDVKKHKQITLVASTMPKLATDESGILWAELTILGTNNALISVGLEHAIKLMPAELSGGMRKRIGLARTLMLKPEIIFYDEPTTGLDPITAREISQLILDVQNKYKTSSIVITHDIECAALVANRILILEDGKVLAEGDYNSLSNSKDPWINSFFNAPKK